MKMPIKFPVLYTNRLILRNLLPDDVLDYHEIFQYEDIKSFLAEEDIPVTIKDSMEDLHYWNRLFDDKQSIYWGISLINNNKIIGGIGFNYIHFQNKRAEINYDLHPSYWRQGIMSEAMIEVIDFAFHNIGIHRIEARTTLMNKPSQKMLEKLGFIHECVQKGYRISQNKALDVSLYSILGNFYT